MLISEEAVLVDHFGKAKERLDGGMNHPPQQVDVYKQDLYDYSSKLLVHREKLSMALGAASLTLNAEAGRAIDRFDSFQDLSYKDPDFVKKCEDNVSLLQEIGADLSAAGRKELH